MIGSSNLLVRTTFHGGLGLLLFGLLGCGSKEAEKAELPPPMVTVARPTERMVTRYEFATGRTAPLEQVEIRARVSGYLKSIRFQPGREVTKGAPLFLIDPEPFEAELAKAKAALETAEADLKSAEADQLRAEAKRDTTKKSYDREEESLKKGVGSPQTRDIAKGMYDEAAAATLSAKAKVILSKAKIDESKASYRSAELNLGYCTIDAPISGIVGDQLVTEGNLVTGGVGNTTLLTTIVAIDKMDVTFDVDESTKQRIEAAVRQGKIKELKAGEVPVEAGVSIHGTGYPLKGVIVFQDNRVDEKTGTIRLKARFDNPKPPTGQRLLAAGMYTRVRVPIGEPVLSMLVQDAAFGSDQGIRFLYLVGPDNKATRWNANTGNLEEGVRVVESVEIPGREKPRPLTRDDRIIVTGIQRVRPGMTVEPKPAAK